MLDPTGFHCMDKTTRQKYQRWWAIFQSIFFCIPQKKELHSGMKQQEEELLYLYKKKWGGGTLSF